MAQPSVRVSVRTHDGLQYSFGRALVTPALLRRLFDIAEPGPLALIDVETLDVVSEDDDGRLAPLQPGRTYQAVPQAVIDESDEELERKYMPDLAAPPRAIAPGRVQAVRGAVREFIRCEYRPAHPELYTLDEAFLDPTFAAHAKAGRPEALTRVTTTGLYTGRVLDDAFCAAFVDEIGHLERSGMPLSRPNSMNNYGIVLQDVGLDAMVGVLLLRYLAPLAAALYPDEAAASSLDSMHSFVVQYKLSEDRALDFHYDDAHVTLNVCLGKDFRGGDLYFSGLLDDPSTHGESHRLAHQPGHGCVHLGRHRHGAQSIEAGERYNLIVWCRSHEHYERLGRANADPLAGHSHGR